jgi:saccharopine dehydrogenase (NAD+, L-lysine forming)
MVVANSSIMNSTEPSCIDLNNDRPYDVGVIGGYGNVGIEAVNYLFNNVSGKLLVGARSIDKAKEILKERGLKDVHVQQVDISNEEQVREFCYKCRIVINCAGPSHKVEDRVAKVAAETASNFIDIGIMEVLMDKVAGFAGILDKNKCACIYATGLHPGLDDIFAFYADQKARELMDEFDSFEIYFGDKAAWHGQGALRDIVWGIHQDYMSAYFRYYDNGKWKKPGIFNMFKNQYFPDVGNQRYALMFQPLIKPFASRYKKIICYGLLNFSFIFSALKIKFFMKRDEAKAVKYLSDCFKKRREKFASLAANAYLYAVVKGKKNNQPVTLKLSMVIAGDNDADYWIVGIIPAIAAQMMLDKQITFVGAKSLAEIVNPEIFMKVLEDSVCIKCKIEQV